MTNDVYSTRRRSLLQQIGPNSIAILGARGECKRSASQNYPFRQESDFYYLTGHKETDAVLVLVPGREEGECIFFTRNADPVRDLWFGKDTEQTSICNLYGCDQTFIIDELETIIPTLLANKEKVFFKIGYDAEFDAQIMRWVHVVKAKEREGIIAPHIFVNVETILHAMRIKKDAKEIALIRKAAAITAQAHLRAMQACKPGIFEYELEAELLYEFTRSGARAQAFQTIVGGGANACTLHYCKNDEVLVDGELVLLDAGAEYQYYAADVSRRQYYVDYINLHSEQQQAIVQEYNEILQEEVELGFLTPEIAEQEKTKLVLEISNRKSRIGWSIFFTTISAFLFFATLIPALHITTGAGGMFDFFYQVAQLTGGFPLIQLTLTVLSLIPTVAFIGHAYRGKLTSQEEINVAAGELANNLSKDKLAFASAPIVSSRMSVNTAENPPVSFSALTDSSSMSLTS